MIDGNHWHALPESGRSCLELHFWPGHDHCIFFQDDLTGYLLPWQGWHGPCSHADAISLSSAAAWPQSGPPVCSREKSYALRGVNSNCDECSYHPNQMVFFFWWCVGHLSVHVDTSSSSSHGGAHLWHFIFHSRAPVPHPREFPRSRVPHATPKFSNPRPPGREAAQVWRRLWSGIGASSFKHCVAYRPALAEQEPLRRTSDQRLIHSSPSATDFEIVCGRGCFLTLRR